MKDTVFIVVDSSGVVRMTKRWPSLARNEIGVKLALSVPDDAFRSFLISVAVNVPDDRIIQPDIEVDAIDPEGGVERSND